MAEATRILGTGVDMTEVARIRALLAKPNSQRFADRVFTAGEQDYCRSRGRPAESYAARFAAKEAVMKALRTGWTRGLTFRDIEVRRDDNGAPEVVLHGEALAHADRVGIRTLHLSLSHTAELAIAFVVAEG